MIKHLRHNEVDKKKWDDCIDNAFNGIIYAYSWYLDIVCPTWDALIEDDYEKVMPLTHNNKLGISYLYPPLFTQQLGVFSKISLSSSDVENFISIGRLKDFLYFPFMKTQLSGQEFPVEGESLAQFCLREKSVNHIIHHLTKK